MDLHVLCLDCGRVRATRMAVKTDHVERSTAVEDFGVFWLNDPRGPSAIVRRAGCISASGKSQFVTSGKQRRPTEEEDEEEKKTPIFFFVLLKKTKQK